MNDKFLSLLGMARRSGKLSLGHDAAISSIVKNRAKLCVMSKESSERLQKEMMHACTFENKNIPLLITEYTTLGLSSAIGSKAAVITVDDEGFVKALIQRYNENTDNTGRKE
ncbi:MAG: ribosomal L7Ae/L30e/S12e/Gadd45 family protein [Clostridia bacterium]|nr:ribosomal L7Ae/L30e/S12e/Gadd45 family protein [Clostridia bacterium]